MLEQLKQQGKIQEIGAKGQQDVSKGDCEGKPGACEPGPCRWSRARTRGGGEEPGGGPQPLQLRRDGWSGTPTSMNCRRGWAGMNDSGEVQRGIPLNEGTVGLKEGREEQGTGNGQQGTASKDKGTVEELERELTRTEADGSEGAPRMPGMAG